MDGFLCSKSSNAGLPNDPRRCGLGIGYPPPRGRGALFRAIAAAGPDGDFLCLARRPKTSSATSSCSTQRRLRCHGREGVLRCGVEVSSTSAIGCSGEHWAFLEAVIPIGLLQRAPVSANELSKLGGLQSDEDESVESNDKHLLRYGGRLLGGAEEDPLSQRLSPALMVSCVMAGCSALCFGYDAGASSGALHNLVKVGSFPGVHFGPVLQGWIVSSRWAGVIGGTVAVYFAPTIRTALIASGVFNVIGSFVSIAAPKLWILIAGRVLCGIGDGLCLAVLCQYTAEISPPGVRGGAIAFQETTFIVGALVGSVYGHHWISIAGGWRYIWGMTLPVGLVAGLLMSALPETPRSIFAKRLAEARRGELQMAADSGSTGSAGEVSLERQHAAAMVVARAEAEQALIYVRGLAGPDEALIEELDGIEENVQAVEAQAAAGEDADCHELSLFEILSSPVHRRLLLAGAVAMGSPALSGHPAIMSYATQVFQSVGFDAGEGSGLAVLLYGTKLVATLPDFLWLDMYGRRYLMAVGLAGIGCSYVLCGLAAKAGTAKLAAAALIGGTIFYQSSVGPISWIVPAEAIPTDMRQRGSALVSLVYASSVLVVVQLHPLLQQKGTVVFLAVYTCTSAIAYVLNDRFLPETRGKRLEQIEEEARSGSLFAEIDGIAEVSLEASG